jgi:hypothetical protein
MIAAADYPAMAAGDTGIRSGQFINHTVHFHSGFGNGIGGSGLWYP